ncbi:hypothetical protein [Microbacterium sp.]|uniref:hypothetical protein n=1 Tax=Microbacterium sp. TaxID=51671 RepID=UPI002639EC57|nr:hypothetical protein [Microbacterium sp.]
MHGRRGTWLAGGIGLIACGVVGVIRSALLGAPEANTVLTLLADVLWAVSILLVAVGRDRHDSVVARRPVGLVASAAVALWPLTHTVVGVFSEPISPAQVDAWMFWTYLSIVLPVIVGAIAATQIARAGVVPAPWNWAPTWALGAQVVIWVLPQLIGATAPNALAGAAGIVAALSMLGFVIVTFGLGILAVVLANRPRAATVPVFTSPSRT